MAVKSIIGAELEPSAVDGIVTDAKYIIDRLNGYKFQSQINSELIQRINKIESLLIGVMVSVEPKTLTFGQLSSVIISVTANTEADSVKIYRNGTEIYSNAVSGTEWEYTDVFTPDAVGEVIYKAVVVIDGSTIKENEASVTVQEDELVSITWAGGSISPSTVPVGGTATLTKGTVTANYASGRTENVTNSAEFVTNGDGYIDGTTYHPRSTAGPEDIFPRYGGKSATNPIMVMVIEQTHLPVYVGAGTDYASAVLINTEEPLTNNMGVTIRTNNNDYLFIKVDKRDTVNNLYLSNDAGEQFNYPIPLEDAVIDGDYKYYRSEKRYNAGRVNYTINKV